MSVYQKRHSRHTDRDPSSGAKTGGSRKRSEGTPLDAATRSSLEPGFGHSLADIRIYADDHADRLSQDFNADAFTVGQDIFFAQGNYNPSSDDGKHLLTHEVAHAVQQRGVQAEDFSGLPVSNRHARSETEAHTATQAVMRGKPAHVSASAGPMVSRWEAGEHKHAVDDSIPKAMQGKITLANGVQVTPGEITAMMGDLYGKFDTEVGQDGKKTEHFNPTASFEQMSNADPKEMQRLLKLIDHEADNPKELSESADWARATRNRRDGDGYLDLAKKNNSHFSAASPEGTDNNMGAYSAFHKMALEAAQNGDMEKARALEASGDHFLTDRFSAGHNFDKGKVMEASGQKEGWIVPWDNLAVKTVHDDLNENGTTVNDAKGASWRAYGDGHWADDANANNRQHTKAAVAGSWDELAQVNAHKTTAADLEKNGPSATQAVPQWDPQREEGAEALARGTSKLDMLGHYGGQTLDVIEGQLWSAEGWAENKLSDGWDWTKEKAGQAWDAGGRAANWIGHEAVAGAHAVENGAKAVGHEVVQDAKYVGHEVAQGAKAVEHGVVRGAEAVGHAASTAGHAVGHAASTAGHAVATGAEAVGHEAKKAWHWATDWI